MAHERLNQSEPIDLVDSNRVLRTNESFIR